MRRVVEDKSSADEIDNKPPLTVCAAKIQKSRKYWKIMGLCDFHEIF